MGYGFFFVNNNLKKSASVLMATYWIFFFLFSGIMAKFFAFFFFFGEISHIKKRLRIDIGILSNNTMLGNGGFPLSSYPWFSWGEEDYLEC